MVKFAPVCGFQMMLDLLMQHPSYVGDYHLWLAHDVLKNQYEWEQIAGVIRREYPDATIIMDNSLIELGSAMSQELILQASLCVSADYLVLPDVLEECVATIDASRAFLREVRKEDLPKTMGVVQGKNFAELLRCAVELEHMGVDAIAIPRIVQKTMSRKEILRMMVGGFPQMKFHLLGFSDNFSKDVEACQSGKTHPQLMGIDSAVPIRCGQQNLLMNHWNANKVGKRDPDYLERSDPPTPHTLVNLMEIRKDINA